MGKLEQFDIPRMQDKFGFEERCRKYGEKVVIIVRFISLESENITDNQRTGLAEIDRSAQKTADDTGNLAHYEQGERGADRIADNECWWDNSVDARNIVHTPEHIAATRYMIQHAVYDDFYIEIYDVDHTDDGQLALSLSRTMTKEDLEAHMSPAYLDQASAIDEHETTLVTAAS